MGHGQRRRPGPAGARGDRTVAPFPEAEGAGHAPDLRARQAARFAALADAVAEGNRFYLDKWAPLGFGPAKRPALADLSALPLTTKAELVANQAAHPPFGTDLTFPLADYTRLHHTSGTTGRPLYWLDTPESWAWWLDCWIAIYGAAGVTRDDRIFVAFSFGPFVGFWAAFEAGQRMGAMVIAGGGQTSSQRLAALRAAGATVLVCTPTYALRLAEVARAEGRALHEWDVRVTIHAGEPGASVPNVRRRLESAWGARCVDHPGATEVGAWGYACGHGDAVHVNEGEFVAEVLGPDDGGPGAADAPGELVLTNLGRAGSPVIRYRTGDLVRLSREPCPCGRRDVVCRGGVLGRVDDMIVVRGVNVFPTAVENLVRECVEVGEFEAEVGEVRGMRELTLRVEVESGDAGPVTRRLGDLIRERLGVRAAVEAVPVGSLPRYEMKARRFRSS